MSDEEKKPRIWEHAWSTEEIRKNSCNWTLAGDVGILNHLQDFSHKLISRTLEMEKVVDSLVHKSKVASAKVNNVINDFQMLSNLQFVENRVYDEEVQESESTSTKEVQPKTKEQREAEMLPRITRALELGVSVLDKAFDRIEVEETSDSEDDDEDAVSRGRTILEPKDNYEHRPLPYVIGSAEFQNDDFAGLRNFVDDEPSMESTQDENVSSSSSSTSESEEEFDEPFIPKQQPSMDGLHRNTVVSVDTMKPKYSDSESSDLFDGGEEENGYISSSPAEKKQDEHSSVNPLMEELMRKSKPVPSSDIVSTKKPETIQTPVVNNGRKASDDLFGGDSGDELFNDDYSPFHKKSLFSSDGIFGSGKEGKSDDESDLFNEDQESSNRKPSISKVKVLPSPVTKVQVLPFPSKKTSVSSTKNTLSKAPEDEEDDLFGGIEKSDSSIRRPAPLTKVQVLPSPVPKSKVLPTETIPKSKEIKRNKEPDLFGDDDDEGDDLFSSLSTKSLSSLQKEQPISSKVAVAESNKKPEKSMPSPSVSERSNKSLFDAAKEPSESASLFDDDSDSEDLFSSSKKTSNQKTFSFNFAADARGDEEDDLFSNKPVSKETKSSKPEVREVTKSSQMKAVSLFEESDSFDLFKPTEPKQKAEDLFAKNLSKSNVPEKDVNRLDTPAPSQKQATLLFDESDSFDLFLPVNKKEEKKSEPVKVDKKPQETKNDQVPISADKDISKVVDTVQPQRSSVKAIQPDTAGTDHVEVSASFPELQNLHIKPTQPGTTEINYVEVVASFDNPSDTGSTLSAINKGRAKIQTKRKKPTRKHRQACISADLNEVNTEGNAETINVIPPPSESSSSPSSNLFNQIDAHAVKVEPVSSVPPPTKSPSTHRKKENDKKNLMSQLMLEAQNSKLLKQNVSPVIGDEDYDIFSSKPLGTVRTSGSEDFSIVSPTAQMPDKVIAKTNATSEGPKPEGSSLLLSDSTSDEDLFSASAFKDFRNSLSKNSIFEQDDEDDDIFKSTDAKDNLSRHSSEVLGDASDDIFAGVQKEKYEMFPTQVFDDDDDDDDIFSNLTVSSTRKGETKRDQKPNPSKKSQDDIFDDPLGVA